MMTSGAESVTRNSKPPTTEASARFAPTERSMPRVKITRCWPTATIAITAVWATMILAVPWIAYAVYLGAIVLMVHVFCVNQVCRGPLR